MTLKKWMKHAHTQRQTLHKQNLPLSTFINPPGYPLCELRTNSSPRIIHAPAKKKKRIWESQPFTLDFFDAGFINFYQPRKYLDDRKSIIRTINIRIGNHLKSIIKLNIIKSALNVSFPSDILSYSWQLCFLLFQQLWEKPYKNDTTPI